MLRFLVECQSATTCPVGVLLRRLDKRSQKLTLNSPKRRNSSGPSKYSRANYKFASLTAVFRFLPKQNPRTRGNRIKCMITGYGAWWAGGAWGREKGKYK